MLPILIRSFTLALALLIGLAARGDEPAGSKPPDEAFDVIIRGGTLLDGTGRAGVRADVAIRGDRIASIGDLKSAQAPRVIDATGLIVAPGFINMLSWATTSLLADGRSQGDIRQGVTLEVFGEGWSMGPLNARMKQDLLARQGDIKFEVPWTTLGEYLQHLQDRGVSCNVASFVGANNFLPCAPASAGQMQLLGQTVVAPAALSGAAKVVASVRPEKVRVNQPLPGAGLQVPGVLRHAMFTGRELQLAVDVAGHGSIEALTAPLEAMVALRPGETVQLGIPASDLLFFAPGDTGRRLA